ncbi:1,4-alpha-glucan branching protein GlgB [Eubacteriales bacterium OttesenSCG-928-K08]|nr:1,4-alpha-glucan branching protein GlgB [Eubacteriales bacterium OttesenSCG-928-K08]
MRGKPDPTSLYYFNIGESDSAYEILGAHPDRLGCNFTVWAPSAQAVHLAGGFNEFNPTHTAMQPIGETGVWEVYVPGIKRGEIYKYVITGPDGAVHWRTDPYAMCAEPRPGTASMVWGIPKHKWEDAEYFKLKKAQNVNKEPMSVYEVHLGSFSDGLSYRELAHQLVDYVADMGYTHIELMPLCEYPLDMSWGYQITSYFAVTSRYGTPEDLMYFVDCAHQKGLGVLLDWVPAHFPRDEHGLRLYDGTALYEHPDPRRGEQTQWGTMLFDYGRTQVHSFLLSNAFFWLKEFHFDGLRVDAVSCILYLDYGKQDGQWLPNEFGGRENLNAIEFFRKLSKRVVKKWPNMGRILVAEESTAFPYVTAPADEGGLGFNYKWNMGWMNDTLNYMQKNPVHRKWHHSEMTFSLCYAFSENYVLPFSHDEVVHGKHSMLDKMPGDYWDKFAQLRLTLSYQFAHPGKKLNFMGTEFGQFIEWRYDEGLDWLLLDYPMHKSMQEFMRALNEFYKSQTPLYQRDGDWGGFSWVSVDDSINSVLAFLRWDDGGNGLLCAFNFTPNPWEEYALSLPVKGTLTEVFSSDMKKYGGTGDWHNNKTKLSERPTVKLPPLGAVFFKLDRSKKESVAAKKDNDSSKAEAKKTTKKKPAQMVAKEG